LTVGDHSSLAGRISHSAIGVERTGVSGITRSDENPDATDRTQFALCP
jgi:hypothetical protein